MAAQDEQEYAGNGTDGAAPVRQLAAERLAAHRSRRAESQQAQALRQQIEAQTAVRLAARRERQQSEGLQGEGRGVSSRVRDAVAERYKSSVSYQEFLAAEAERALQQARAEAEVAARNAIAVAEAQRQLLEEIEQWNQPVPAPALLEVVPKAAAETVDEPRAVAARAPRAEATAAELKVQLYAELPVKPLAAVEARAVVAQVTAHENLAEAMAELDQEIAFRLAPEFQEHVVETRPIEANLIEFPRQLVASRKARPRLAEGPLREDGTPEPQLRIFEVEPEQISVEPAAVEPSAAPEWQGLLLAGPGAEHAAAFAALPEALAESAVPLHTPPVELRLMAGTVDACCLLAGMVMFVAVAGKIDGAALRTLSLPVLGGAVAGTLAFFAVVYRLLFFTLNEATPGMRYARLAFCTFADTNPTRRAIRRRMVSTALALCPLGLGLVWMAMDPDRLGWHDRMSRMYPRHY